MIDALALAQDLIRRPSVTPADAGAMAVLESALGSLGFRCRRLSFEGIENLYARRGDRGPNLCFAGHTDVVPPGDESAWTHTPFSGTVADGVVHGRGAVDMKGAIAAFVAACSRVRHADHASVSLLITGDEEGEAVNGTRRVLEALAADGERIDHCIVGEPTSASIPGDTIKVGRRGSLNATVCVTGVQGHVAYPERAANPVPALLRVLGRLEGRRLDEGYPEFPPSNLEITDLEVGNPVFNLIPARAKARLNIRFNPAHRGGDLEDWIGSVCRDEAKTFGGDISAAVSISGEAFLTRKGDLTDIVQCAVKSVIGREAELSTSGGTSDARFISAYAPVVELGLCGATMHKVDEGAPVSDLNTLTDIYARILASYPSVSSENHA